MLFLVFVTLCSRDFYSQKQAGILRKCNSNELIYVMLLAATATSRPSSRDLLLCRMASVLQWVWPF